MKQGKDQLTLISWKTLDKLGNSKNLCKIHEEGEETWEGFSFYTQTPDYKWKGGTKRGLFFEKRKYHVQLSCSGNGLFGLELDADWTKAHVHWIRSFPHTTNCWPDQEVEVMLDLAIGLELCGHVSNLFINPAWKFRPDPNFKITGWD